MTAEYIINQAKLHEAQCDYELAIANANFLNISLDEYFDFVRDMNGMVEDSLTADELEQMYVEYCQEYDIPCKQIDDYSCVDIMGW